MEDLEYFFFMYTDRRDPAIVTMGQLEMFDSTRDSIIF